MDSCQVTNVKVEVANDALDLSFGRPLVMSETVGTLSCEWSTEMEACSTADGVGLQQGTNRCEQSSQDEELDFKNVTCPLPPDGQACDGNGNNEISTGHIVTRLAPGMLVNTDDVLEQKVQLADEDLSNHTVVSEEENDEADGSCASDASTVSVSTSVQGNAAIAPCLSCGRHFRWNWQLAAHMKEHTDSAKSDTGCGQMTLAENDSNCVSGASVVTEPVNKSCHQCNVCGRVLKTAHSLKLHYQIHSGQKLLSCIICGERFRWPKDLALHKRKHRKNVLQMAAQLHSCRVCKMTFKHRARLTAHMSLHTRGKCIRAESLMPGCEVSISENVATPDGSASANSCSSSVSSLCHADPSLSADARVDTISDNNASNAKRTTIEENMKRDCKDSGTHLTRGKVKRQRTSLTAEQSRVLQTAITLTAKLTDARCEKLIAETGLDKRVIKVWFANHRRKGFKCISARDVETARDPCEQPCGVKKEDKVKLVNISSPQGKSKTSTRASSQKSEKSEFKCRICRKVLKSAAGVVNHVDIVHHHRRGYRCHKCGKRYRDLTLYRSHKCETSNNQSEGIHADNIGVGNVTRSRQISDKGTNLSNRSLEQEHIVGLSSLAEKLVPVRKSSLRKIKMFKCNICGRRCKLQIHLRQHMLIHSSDTVNGCCDESDPACLQLRKCDMSVGQYPAIEADSEIDWNIIVYPLMLHELSHLTLVQTYESAAKFKILYEQFDGVQPLKASQWTGCVELNFKSRPAASLAILLLKTIRSDLNVRFMEPGESAEELLQSLNLHKSQSVDSKSSHVDEQQSHRVSASGVFCSRTLDAFVSEAKETLMVHSGQLSQTRLIRQQKSPGSVTSVSVPADNLRRKHNSCSSGTDMADRRVGAGEKVRQPYSGATDDVADRVFERVRQPSANNEFTILSSRISPADVISTTAVAGGVCSISRTGLTMTSTPRVQKTISDSLLGHRDVSSAVYPSPCSVVGNSYPDSYSGYSWPGQSSISGYQPSPIRQPVLQQESVNHALLQSLLQNSLYHHSPYQSVLPNAVGCTPASHTMLPNTSVLQTLPSPVGPEYSTVVAQLSSLLQQQQQQNSDDVVHIDDTDDDVRVVNVTDERLSVSSSSDIELSNATNTSDKSSVHLKRSKKDPRLRSKPVVVLDVLKPPRLKCRERSSFSGAASDRSFETFAKDADQARRRQRLGATNNYSSSDTETMSSSSFNTTAEKLTAFKSKKRRRATYGKRSLTCDICRKRFFNETRFTIHLQQHASSPHISTNKHSTLNDNQTFKCKSCRKYFQSKSSLKLHIRRQHREKDEDEACVRKQASEEVCYDVASTGSGKQTFKCNICEKEFLGRIYLNMHVRRKHVIKNPVDQPSANLGKTPGVVKCSHCDKVFHSKVLLRKHLFSSHNIGKGFECDICNKIFLNSGSLSIHKRMHTGVKPYRCTTCNATFLWRAQKAHHKCPRVELEQKPFGCGVCGLAFDTEKETVTHFDGHLREAN